LNHNTYQQPNSQISPNSLAHRLQRLCHDFLHCVTGCMDLWVYFTHLFHWWIPCSHYRDHTCHKSKCHTHTKGTSLFTWQCPHSQLTAHQHTLFRSLTPTPTLLGKYLVHKFWTLLHLLHFLIYALTFPKS